MIQDRLGALLAEPHWHSYLRLSKSLENPDEADRRELLELALESLSRVIESKPDHARAHSRLASAHIQLFDLPGDSEAFPLDVQQVREAVVASRFPSSKAMDEWLAKAFGERRRHLYAAWHHARRAVRLCPLQGEAYLYLSELSFLCGPKSPSKADYIRQALKVRPHDGRVLFAAGQDALMTGDPDKAIGFWKSSVRSGRSHRRRVFELLAGRVPVQYIMETFRLDLTAMRELVAIYSRRGDKDALDDVRARYAQACEWEARRTEGQDAVKMWLDAANAFDQLDRPNEQLRCLGNAARRDPTRFDVRLALGKCLLEMNHHGEAEEHLKWCLRHDPEDKSLRRLLESAVDGRLRVTRAPEEPTL
jgi:tetratricopeptide (TPR) repeat protein